MAIVARILTFYAAIAISAHAEEPRMPDFKSPPVRYVYAHETTYTGAGAPPVTNDTDELLIGDVTKNELTFYFYLTDANGHVCGASGSAQASEGAYYYIRPNSTLAFEPGGKIAGHKEVECRLRISFDERRASLVDEGDYCQSLLCGTRAGIGNTHFRREQ